MLEARATDYRQKRKLKQVALGKLKQVALGKLKQVALGKPSVVVSKTGDIMDAGLLPEPAIGLATHRIMVEIMSDQRNVVYKGPQISVPSTLPGRQY